MLKIIFGNIARKDHYCLNKSKIYITSGIEKVTEKIFKKKNLRSVGSGWVGLETDSNPNFRPESDQSIHPTRPRPLGRVKSVFIVKCEFVIGFVFVCCDLEKENHKSEIIV